MRIIHIDGLREKDIHEHGSRGAHIVHLLGKGCETNLVQIRLDPDSLLGMHQAVEDQLFIVIQGSGRVRSSGSEVVVIGEGDAVFWESGEMHETESGPDGLKGLVVEGPSLGEYIQIE